jgi:hypothetical protein
MKLLVITERGRVVGTQPVTPPNANAPATAVLRAGPGQKVHEIEVAVPGDLGTAKGIDAFHRRIAASLRPRKATRRKKAARR